MKKEIKSANITYKMLRSGETTERQISLPISAERYDELAKGLQPNSKAWHEVRDALVTLTNYKVTTNLEHGASS